MSCSTWTHIWELVVSSRGVLKVTDDRVVDVTIFEFQMRVAMIMCLDVGELSSVT